MGFNRKINGSVDLKKCVNEFKVQSFHNQSLNRLLKVESQPVKNIAPNRNIPIYLFYKKQKIFIKSYCGMPFEQLVTILYKEIMDYEYKKCGGLEQAYKNVTNVLGFATNCNDLNLDYLLSIRQGQVTKSLLLECFMANKKTNRLLNYQIYHCLAIGGFSKVYLARSKEDGHFYAIKFIKKKNNDNFAQASVLNEMKICSELKHPFLIKMKEGFETNNFYCMAFEYCPGGELFYLLKRVKQLSEEKAKFYFLQILLGIKYMHENMTLYRDLKPENILIDWQGNMKIVDFGLSKRLSNKKDRTFSYCGSAEYMAPEMILREGHSFAIDHYSLGALLYELVTGLPPFYSKDADELKQSIVSAQLVFPVQTDLSPDLKDLLSRLLQKDSRFRLGSYAGVKEIICHPWIGKCKIDQISNKQLQCPYPPNLKEHNFDINELGDDQQQFSNQIYQEFCTKKAQTSVKTHFKSSSPLDSNLYEDILKKMYDFYVKDQIYKENYRNNQVKNSVQKQRQSYKKTERTLDYLCSSPLKQKSVLVERTVAANSFSLLRSSDQESKQKNRRLQRNKLLPYFTKNVAYKTAIGRYSTHRKVPRTNINRLRMLDNHVMQKQNSPLKQRKI